ncbi:hypothetical protein JCM10450v2_000276 [Rhodotorula kratochvilovae]
MPADRYYGFEDLALLCEHVITSLFSVAPAQQPAADAAAPAAPAAAAPPAPAKKDAGVPQLGEFIAYALYRTRLPVSITHQALLLLTRLKQRYPSARGTSTSPHRLFLSSLMLSSKISMDDTYSNKSWQIVGQGLFELREVNQMERELFAFLGWNVVVRDEELEGWVQEVVTPYDAERELARSLAVAVQQQQQQRKSMDERKRRRDSRPPTPSPSTSRSPSPNTLRHRRASDAAVALLQGHPGRMTSSAYESPSSSSSSSRSGRLRSRQEYRNSSPYSRSSSRAPSTVCSSYASSPAFGHGHGVHTPASPCTPAGPLTPEQADKAGWPLPAPAHLAADASAKLAAYAAMQQAQPLNSSVVDPHSIEAVPVPIPPTY